MAQRSSRKRRKERQRAAQAPVPTSSAEAAEPATIEDPMKRAYSRSRAKDDAARAALEPLAPGERPKAVTVGAIAAGILCVAQLISFILALVLDTEIVSVSRNAGALIGVVLLGVMAVGMWRARYWAVLGMQTLLAIALLYASIAAMFALNWQALLLVVVVIVPCGTLFWFLIKAMARIQMPERPGAGR